MKIMNLPTTKNSSNSEKHGCFLATPCHARGAYFAQGERKILNSTVLGGQYFTVNLSLAVLSIVGGLPTDVTQHLCRSVKA
ncbi:MAG: hypothetical protein WCI11_11390 [Candidatus Methylumidiphilus sp.]